jgi:hypothetical protein
MATNYATSYAAITKSEKQEDGTLLVYGKATDDAIDSDNQICDAGWLNKAMPDWFKTGGNIREQHSNIAAGVAKELDSKADGHYITAHVVDPTSVKKVEAGVLKGFSIGIRAPRIVRDEKAANGRIIDGQIVEVSLVDRPANPHAKLMLAKSEGTEVIQVEEMIEQELPAAEVVEAEITPETTEVVAADAEKRAYGESAEIETDEGTYDSASHEVAEAEGDKPLDKSSDGCSCEGCMKCAADGGCDSKMCKGCTKSEHKSASIDKCLECGCHKPDDNHGSADVTTATMVEEKSSTTILPPPSVERVGDIQDGDIFEEEDAIKSALSATDVDSIIEKAVKSATDSVRNEIETLVVANKAAQESIDKLQTELAAANQKAVSGGPKRATIKPAEVTVNEFLLKAAQMREKAAATTDRDLARGYRELASDFEADAAKLTNN